MRTSTRRGERPVAALEAALAAAELRLSYEPVVRGCNLEILGLEALPTWRGGPGGAAGPWGMVAIAEQAGLVPQLTRWTVGSAAHQLADWQAAGLIHGLVLHVRFPGSALVGAGFAEDVAAEVTGAGLRPSQLYFEVTEDDLERGGAGARSAVERLAGFGCRPVLTGLRRTSSLQSLTRPPFEAVKIGRDLLLNGDQPESLLTEVIEVARVTGMTVLVSGIDAEGDLGRAAGSGLPFVQGAALGPAESAEVLGRRLTAKRAE